MRIEPSQTLRLFLLHYLLSASLETHSCPVVPLSHACQVSGSLNSQELLAFIEQPPDRIQSQ